MHWPILHGVWSGSSSFCQEFPLSSRRGLTGRVACEEVENIVVAGNDGGIPPQSMVYQRIKQSCTYSDGVCLSK